MNLTIRYFVSFYTSFFIFTFADAQQILFDKGIRAGKVMMFPELSDPNSYYYLPDQASVAIGADGNPQFSFLRFVRNKESASTGGIAEANEAGGILHALVTIEIPEEEKRNAQKELQRVNPAGLIKGPIIYKSGKVAIISSIVGADESFSKKVVGIGNAPILEGGKAAVSAHLTKEGADILLASLKTSTPDLSFSFEMDARGYLSPKQVKIEANFEQIYKNSVMEAAVVSPVLACEISAAYDDLMNSGAIKVTQVGDDAELNKMRETAYNQLINLMFDKVGGQSLADLQGIIPGQNKSILDKASDLLQNARKEAREENQYLEKIAREQAQAEQAAINSSKKFLLEEYKRRKMTPPDWLADSTSAIVNAPKVEKVPIPDMAMAASFKMKQVKRTGKYMIDMNKFTEDVRTFPFAANVGNLYKACATCFRDVNLDDPLYKQRELALNLVGINAADFDNYISSVEVVMRKKHETGEESLGNLVISKKTFADEANNFKLMYGWKEDSNRSKWLKYDYKTKWTFSSGVTMETDFINQSFAGIDLIPPLVKKIINVELDSDFVKEEAVKKAEVRVYYKNKDKELNKSISFKISDDLLSQIVEILLPVGVEDFEYEVSLIIKGKDPIKTARKKSNMGLIYIDSLN